jgi:hypothetical protein
MPAQYNLTESLFLVLKQSYQPLSILQLEVLMPDTSLQSTKVNMLTMLYQESEWNINISDRLI